MRINRYCPSIISEQNVCHDTSLVREVRLGLMCVNKLISVKSTYCTSGRGFVFKIRMVDVQLLEGCIIDCLDAKEKISALHHAAWLGDVDTLKLLLQDEQYISAINVGFSPFFGTPLRLAASNGKAECVKLLLSRGAIVDMPDRKNQTPLFCAVKNRDLRSCKLLLQAGASPEGNPGNLSTPLELACQEGFSAGLQILLDHGASIEGKQPQEYSQLPHPLHITACYGYLGCFIALLCSGGVTASAGHVLHVICNKRRHPVFVKLWWQFGGNLWYRDASGLLAVDILDNPLAPLLRTLMETPLSLQSLCRLKLKSSYPKMNVQQLPHPYLRDFLQYWDFLEVKVFQKIVHQEIKHPTGLDLEVKLEEICALDRPENYSHSC